MKTDTLLIVGALGVGAFFLLRKGGGGGLVRGIGAGSPIVVRPGATTPNTKTATAPMAWPSLDINLGGFKLGGIGGVQGNSVAQIASSISAGAKAFTGLWESGKNLFGGSAATKIEPGLAVPASYFEPVKSVGLPSDTFWMDNSDWLDFGLGSDLDYQFA